MFEYVIKTDPFPHIIIENFYSSEELKYIWEELEFLTKNKLKDPHETAPAVTETGKILKKNKACFLLHEYSNDRTKSPILYYTNKLYNPNFVKEVSSKHWLFRYLHICNYDAYLVSYYENGDYYDAHYDTSVLTCFIHLFKEPKCFSGGDLYLPEYDYTFKNTNNRLILFPSSIFHQVNPITMKEEHSNSCNGRYTISKFMGVSV